MKNVEMYYEPLDIFEKLINNPSEMTEHENAFLCGVIRQVKPKKILEVGIAAGGSTICIMNCLQKLDMNCKLYSCDLNTEYYRDAAKNTGYLLKDLKENFNNLHNHKFYLGDCLPVFIDEIGGDIDLVLIDTVHALPGEILDFLICLPYLSENAVVVLHDLCLNFYGRSPEAFATKILFDVVVSSEKYKNNDESRKEKYSNIGMFMVTSETKKNIEDIFSSLSISWSYYPDENMMKKYLDFINKNYSSELYDLFLQCCNLQKMLVLKRDKIKFENVISDFNEIIVRKPIYLYGTGLSGRRIYSYIKMRGGKVNGFVSTKKECDMLLGSNVYTLDEFALLKKEQEELILLLAVNDKFYDEIMTEVALKDLENITYPRVSDEFEVLKFAEVKKFIKLLYETNII